MKIKINKKHKIILAILVFLIIGNFLFLKAKKLIRPNVILITIDATRADHLGCYGYERNTSPNIDKLAKEGVLFTQAISQSSWTISSLPSIMTSRYPKFHQVYDADQALSPDFITLPKILKNNRYLTMAIFATCIFNRGITHQFGFDSVAAVGNDELATRLAIAWLKSAKGKPLFLWVHYFAPHDPYKPPSPYDSRFTLLEDKGNLSAQPPRSFSNIKSIANINLQIALYDGEIAYADAQIGMLWDKIKELKLDKNTLVIISADHGEMLGEHNVYFLHGAYLFKELLHVPLIFKAEGILPKGIKIKYAVQSADIMPTILGILRIKPPAGIDGVNIFSLTQRIEDAVIPRYIFSEIRSQSFFPHRISVSRNNWKLVYNFIEEAYFMRVSLGKLLNDFNLYKINDEFKNASFTARNDRVDTTPLANPALKGGDKGGFSIPPFGTLGFSPGGLHYSKIIPVLNWVKDYKNEDIFLWFHCFAKSKFLKFPRTRNMLYLEDTQYYCLLDKPKNGSVYINEAYTNEEIQALLKEIEKINQGRGSTILLTARKEFSQIKQPARWEFFSRGYKSSPHPREIWQLCDLKADPQEETNLFGIKGHEKIQGLLVKKIVNYLKFPDASGRPLRLELDETEKQRLKSLGYL